METVNYFTEEEKDEIFEKIRDKVTKALNEAISPKIKTKNIETYDKIIDDYTDKLVTELDNQIKKEIDKTITNEVNNTLQRIEKNMFAEKDLTALMQDKEPLSPIVIRENNMKINPVCLQERFNKEDKTKFYPSFVFNFGNGETATCRLKNTKDLMGNNYTDIIIENDKIMLSKNLQWAIQQKETTERPATEEDKNIVKEYMSSYIRQYNHIIANLETSRTYDDLKDVLKMFRNTYSLIQNADKGCSSAYPYVFLDDIFKTVARLEDELHLFTDDYIKGYHLIPSSKEDYNEPEQHLIYDNIKQKILKDAFIYIANENKCVFDKDAENVMQDVSFNEKTDIQLSYHITDIKTLKTICKLYPTDMFYITGGEKYYCVNNELPKDINYYLCLTVDKNTYDCKYFALGKTFPKNNQYFNEKQYRGLGSIKVGEYKTNFNVLSYYTEVEQSKEQNETEMEMD